MVLRRYFPSKSFLLNHSPQDLLGYYLNKKTNCNFSFRRCRGHKGVEFFGFDSSSSCWKRTSISILYDVLAGHHHKFDYRKTIQTSRTILQKIKLIMNLRNSAIEKLVTTIRILYLLSQYKFEAVTADAESEGQLPNHCGSPLKSLGKKLPTTVKFLLCLPILNAIGTWNIEEVSKALIKSTLKSMSVSC